MSQPFLFSIITPSTGKRPLALRQAIESVLQASSVARIADQVEMLVGFDGVKGDRVVASPQVKYVDFPAYGDFGNRIRDGLLKAATGQRVLFVDDDNLLTSGAFSAYLEHMDADMVVAQVETGRAFDVPYLPVVEPGQTPQQVIRQCNVDPLCLSLSRSLVKLCGGWRSQGRYESDFLNIRRYLVRSRTVRLIDDVVGIYDAGRGLDAQGLNERQAGTLGRAVMQRELTRDS